MDDPPAQDWLNYLGFEDGFPRELMIRSDRGRIFRTTVPDEDAYVEEVAAHATKTDVWVAAYPDHGDAEYVRLYLDVDAEGEESYADALEKARTVEDWVYESWGVEPYVQFSAGKGFHLQVDIPNIPVSSRLVRKVFRSHASELPIDLGALGFKDLNLRVPHTVNTGSVERAGRLYYVTPCRLDGDLHDIMASAQRPGSPVDVDIPLCREAARWIVYHAADLDTDFDASSLNGDLSDGRVHELAEEAVRFAFDLAPNLTDGRKRVLRHLLVPGGLHLDAGREGTLAWCREFVEASGASWGRYKGYCETQVEAAQDVDGGVLYPMRRARFLERYPEVVETLDIV